MARSVDLGEETIEVHVGSVLSVTLELAHWD